MSLAQFALDLGKTAALHPWWFGRETLQRLTEVRAKGRARFEHGLPQIYHHLLDPRLERMAVEVGGATWTDNPKAMIVARFCRLLQPETVLEIGTFRGGMTYHIARNTPDACRIWTLDLPPGALDAGWRGDGRDRRQSGGDGPLASRRAVEGNAGSQKDHTVVGRQSLRRFLGARSDRLDLYRRLPRRALGRQGHRKRLQVSRADRRHPLGRLLLGRCAWGARTLREAASDLMFEDGQTAGYVRIDGKPLVPRR